MSHLTTEELIDAIDNVLAGERRSHLASCDACRGQVDEIRQTLRAVSSSDVPEPSPLFWTHLSGRVQEAIAEEPPAAERRLPAWFGWRVLAPLGALALMIAALVNAVPREIGTPQMAEDRVAVDASPLAGGDDSELFDDPSWQLMSELAGEMDLDEASQSGFVIPGALERAAFDLDPTERAELLRLLRAELGRPES